jgi:hypothetical protein
MNDLSYEFVDSLDIESSEFLLSVLEDPETQELMIFSTIYSKLSFYNKKEYSDKIKSCRDGIHAHYILSEHGCIEKDYIKIIEGHKYFNPYSKSGHTDIPRVRSSRWYRKSASLSDIILPDFSDYLRDHIIRIQ